jgi:hypothetical protein
MAFRTGTVAYARFSLDGNPPTQLDESVLETLATNRIRPTTVGTPPEVEFGWIGGRHVFDERFDREDVAFGDRLMIGMRIDTNKVPSEMRNAYRALAEQELAASSSTGFIGRSEKRAARESADERCRAELATGRYRNSKMLPVLWDLPRRLVLAPAVSDAAFKALATLFDACFDARLEPLTAGAIASRFASTHGLNSTCEDLRPSSFTDPPALASSDDGRDLRIPLVPWSQQGPEPKDYLGNEFLLWLWWQTDVGTGMIETARGTVAIALDRTLDLQCAWDVTGKVLVNADRATKLNESREAIRLGKWPRKVGFMLADNDTPVEGAVQVDRFVVSSLKLPKLEDAQTPRDILEHRIDQTVIVDTALVSLYESFLDLRLGDRWTTQRGLMIDWIAQRSAKTAPKVEYAHA